MAMKEAARRSCHSERAKDVHQDMRIVAQDEQAWKLLPIVFGAFFAAMLVIQIAMGW